MANNYDISGGRGNSEDLDVRFSSSTPSGDLYSEKPADASAQSDIRRKRAEDMAKRIAMSIGDDDYESTQPVNVNERQRASALENEVTRERAMASRQTRPSGQRASQGQRTASGQRRPAAQRSSAAGSRNAGAGQRRPGTRPAGSASRKRRKKKSSGGKTAAVFLVGFLLLVVGMAYFIGLVLTNGAFLPNTTINGVDVSKMTLQEATEAVDNNDVAKSLVLTNADGSVAYSILLDEFGYSFDIDEQVAKFYSEIDRKVWFKSLFATTEYTLDTSANYDEKKLQQRLSNIKWATVEPQNAFITKTANGYQIVPAVDGNEVDAQGLVAHILDEVKNGNLRVNIGDFYSVKPAEIQSADLQEQLEYYENFSDFKITIDFDYTQEVLSMDDYATWLEFSPDGNYTVKEDEVAHYVGYLADTYDTYGTTRSFNATLQGNIRVSQGPQGTYGWMIDKEKTVERLTKVLLAGETTTIDPVYATRLDKYGVAFFTYKGQEDARSAGDDIGNTYIEVDLTAQRMWYYENGVCKFQTDQIVSGLASDSDRITPEGVYEILEKKSPDYLSGDGYSDVYVKYFIRVSYEGIGFHDLSRGSYGGNIYLTNGSHGCINMKLAEVEKLYGMVKGGTPVVMYY